MSEQQTAFDASAIVSGTLASARMGVGSVVQAYDSDLTIYAGITPSANVQSLLGAADYAAMRTQLGLGTMATQSAAGVAITDGTLDSVNITASSWSGGTIASLTSALAIADGGTGATDAASARSTLGCGTISTQSSGSVSITGGSITGITDLAIADGGTGSSTALAAIIALATPWQHMAVWTSSNLSASTNYYFSALPPGSGSFAMSTSASNRRVYVTRACKVIAVTGNISVAGTLSSNHNSTLAVLVNGSTASTVSSTVATTATNNSVNATGLSISLAAGDYYELRLATGAFTTAPTTTGGQFTIELVPA